MVADQLINLALETVKIDKQALIFCNTKRGAESQAEKISKQILKQGERERLNELSEKILHVLESPTKQCTRLAAILKGGCAFHHAGLHYKQREIIEDAFRAGEIFIICSTPTLAMGLDMPAFRSIIRDTKRFVSGKGWGMSNIPVLEYEQMSGRAGRPGKETYGEAILVANDVSQAEELTERYIEGEPEEIYSKLAVEPVLRTYLLSLIATGFVKNQESMYAFFDETFYAKQYSDTAQLHGLLDKMLTLLKEWEFIHIDNPNEQGDFTTAASMMQKSKSKYMATPAGRRVAELYLDPYTANFLIENLKEAKELPDEGLLHLLTSTLEMRPLLSVKAKEYDIIESWLIEHEEELIVPEPTQYSYEYEEYLSSIKTTMFLADWIDEVTDDTIFEKYGVRPGELRMKTEISDWLLYACEELAKLLDMKCFSPALAKMRLRLKNGVREELLPLMRFKGIGKVRARKLFSNSVRSVADVKSADDAKLAGLIGPAMTRKLKEQVGIKSNIAVPKRKRVGQKSLNDWG